MNKKWIKLVVITIASLSAIALKSSSANEFSEQEVNPDRFIAVAVPFGYQEHKLEIIEQIPDGQPCWSEQGISPVKVDLLLLNFANTGSCRRIKDSNGYSIRIDGNEDKSSLYLISIIQRNGELQLVAKHENPDLPELIIGRSNGLGEGILKIALNPGWKITKRLYQGNTLGHVYLSGDSTAFLPEESNSDRLVMINEPPTDDDPPYSLAIEPAAGEYIPISNLDVFTPNPEFNRQQENQIDTSTSTKKKVTPLGEAKPIPQAWQDFLQEEAKPAIAFQPATKIIKVGSPNKTPPVTNTPVWNSDRLITDNVPKQNSLNSGAIINLVTVDHNLQFDRQHKGMAIRIDANVWHSVGQDAFINVYVKKADSSYVQSKDDRYATDNGLLASGQKVKIPYRNTHLKTVLYLPYSAFKLPLGKHENLTIQAQIQLSSAVANDESYQFELALAKSTLPPVSEDGLIFSPESSSNVSQAEAFLINGYFGCCIPEQVKRVLETEKGAEVDSRQNPLPWGFRGLGIKTYVGDWNDLDQKQGGATVTTDERFRRQMHRVISQGDSDLPLILIGHSFGGDSLLKVARCEAGNDAECATLDQRTSEKNRQRRKILFFGAIDPTQFGGIRATSSVPDNVNYFFNRWTKNPKTIGKKIKDQWGNNGVTIVLEGIVEVFIPTTNTLGKIGIPFGANIPLDANSTGLFGDTRCHAQQCKDQKEQSIARNWNGEPIKESCGWYENCPGKVLPTLTRKGSNGKKHKRIDHSEIVNDDRVQYEMLQVLTQLVSQLPSKQPSVCQSEKLGKILMFYQDTRGEINTDGGLLGVDAGASTAEFPINAEGIVKPGTDEEFDLVPFLVEFGYDPELFLSGGYGDSFIDLYLDEVSEVGIKLIEIPQSCQ